VPNGVWRLIKEAYCADLCDAVSVESCYLTWSSC
jgi:hypothetical protein